MKRCGKEWSRKWRKTEIAAAQTTAAAGAAEAVTTEAAASAATTATAAAAARQTEYTTRVKLRANITTSEPLTDNAMYEWFSDKFQVDMEYIPMLFGERHEKARIWAASGDVPDILWMDLNENLYTEWVSWIEGGLFKPFPKDLGGREAISATFDQMIGDEMLTVDGELYALPCMQDSASYDFQVSQGFAYRADWAEQLGLRKEGDIYTWEEFVDLMRAFIEKDPGGNGAGKTYGMSAPQWYFPDCFGIWQLQHPVWGTEEPSFLAQDGKYVWAPSQDNFIEGLVTAKKLFEDGVIWQDNVVDTNSTMYYDLYIAGQMGALVDNLTASNLKTRRDAMLKANPSLDREKCYAIAKVASPGKPDEFWQKESPCYWSATSMSASVSEDQMNRYLDIFNWILTDEGKYFKLYGLEGIDYTAAADGTVNLLWQKNDQGLYIDPYPNGSRSFYTRMKLSGAEDAFTNVALPEMDRRDAKDGMDFYFTKGTVRHLDYNLFYTSTPNKDRYGLFIEEVKAKLIEVMSTTNADNVEQVWRDWIATMIPKVQPVLDDLNQLPCIPATRQEMMDYVSATRQ
ncbi:MAG: extracellular solute-binding protein [Clostridiales bacterium]|nr:extracellular solute-binding protein [Clostridiales bacterium]